MILTTINWIHLMKEYVSVHEMYTTHKEAITKCDICRHLTTYLLGSSLWEYEPIHLDNLRNVHYICMEIYNGDIDHTVIILKQDGKYWMVQSYILRYTPRVTPIDIEDFIRDMHLLSISFDASIWYRWFHARIYSNKPPIIDAYHMKNASIMNIQGNMDTLCSSSKTSINIELCNVSKWPASFNK